MSSTAQRTGTSLSSDDDSPAGRARFHDPANFFAFQLPAVPRRQFVAERATAFAANARSTEVLLDASDLLGTAYPATTPTLLARYLRLRPAEPLVVNRATSGDVYYVLRGRGLSEAHGERIAWAQGDVFAFPGGAALAHSASDDAILFNVSNEPLLAFEALRPPAPGSARVGPVHWRAVQIDARFDAIYARPRTADTAGLALQLSSTDMAPACHTLPSMNVAINTLPPGGDQRPHRHNGVAITLAVRGEGVYSEIEGERIDWVTGAAQITPAAELHAHYNRGPGRMLSLVVQDEGLHFYTRTPGFSWD